MKKQKDHLDNLLEYINNTPSYTAKECIGWMLNTLEGHINDLSVQERVEFRYVKESLKGQVKP